MQRRRSRRVDELDINRLRGGGITIVWFTALISTFILAGTWSSAAAKPVLASVQELKRLAAESWEVSPNTVDIVILRDRTRPAISEDEARKMVEDADRQRSSMLKQQGLLSDDDNGVMLSPPSAANSEAERASRLLRQANNVKHMKQRIRVKNGKYRLDQVVAQEGEPLPDDVDYTMFFVDVSDAKHGVYGSFLVDQGEKHAFRYASKKHQYKREPIVHAMSLGRGVGILRLLLGERASGASSSMGVVPSTRQIELLSSGQHPDAEIYSQAVPIRDKIGKGVEFSVYFKNEKGERKSFPELVFVVDQENYGRCYKCEIFDDRGVLMSKEERDSFATGSDFPRRWKRTSKAKSGYIVDDCLILDAVIDGDIPDDVFEFSSTDYSDYVVADYTTSPPTFSGLPEVEHPLKQDIANERQNLRPTNYLVWINVAVIACISVFILNQRRKAKARG